MIRAPEKAVWDKREYRRHSVEDDVTHFCGWPLLLKLVGHANTKAQKRLIAFLFETGGRISEVLELRTDVFHVVKDAKPPILIVRGMPLKKKYRKVSEMVECLSCHTRSPKASRDCAKCGEDLLNNGKRRFKTRRLERVRSEFVIRCDEPLAKIVLRAIVECMKHGEPQIFKNSNTGKLYGRRWAYKVLRKVGEKVGVYMYPHRLRSERACHLASSLKAESVLEWFSWEDWETAKRYAKKGAMGLAKELGVELPKTVN